MLAACLTTLLFSISVICAQQSTKVMGGNEANFWRLALATCLLGIYAGTFGQGIGGVAFPMFLFSGLIGVGLGDVALFQALPRLGSRLTLLILQCLSAPFAAFFEWIWLGTRLNAGQFACIGIILTGVAVALLPDKKSPPKITDWRNGLWICIISALGNAGGAVISRQGFQVAAENAQSIDGATAAFQRLLGGLFISGLCLLYVRRHVFRTARWLHNTASPMPVREKWRRAGPWVLLNATAGQTLGVTCYLWAFKTVPAGVVLSIVALTPLVAVPLTRYIEGEIPTKRSLLGTAISVAGAIGLVWATTR
jgi:drug/metabolite transporter (DMT)-like permease